MELKRMKVKKDKTLTHLFFSMYTTGFVYGMFLFFIVDTNIDFQISFTIEKIFCLFVSLPIIYWVYRYVGIVFNDQELKYKLTSFALLVLGIFFGLFFLVFLLV